MHPSNRPTAFRPCQRSFGLGLAGAGLALAFSGAAAAATEADSPSPNVLLLVDSSGSMESKTDGSAPSCVPGDLNSERSRWIELTEVLTGRFVNYSCWSQDRSSAAFKSEFMLGGVVPYDFGYINQYHRALSGKCLVGPGVLPSPDAFSWPTNAVNTYELSPLSASGVVLRAGSQAALAIQPPCAGFAQQDDGLLDIYKNQVRFGLMTFDARVDAGIGYSGITPDYTTGSDGNWSYFLGAKAKGHPANCFSDVDQEVGARNAAAPPWEGRMIAFGAPDLADNTERNNWIQQTLMATRPYGATPLNGQLYDARDFLWNDNSTDPLDPAGKFGPKDDTNWTATDCRKTIMIILSDGEPNLDLRPYCEAPSGACPYPDPPQKVVRDLRLAPPDPDQSVETYVIGFGLGTVRPIGGPPAGVSCRDLSDAQCLNLNQDFVAFPDNKAVQACCTLREIAAAGGNDALGVPRKAFFADSGDQLRDIFTTILNGVIRAATRTSPVFSSNGDSGSKGFKFAASFETQPVIPGDPASLWRGQLERHRFLCSDALDAQEQDVDVAQGDDFAANLNEQPDDRRFYTVIGDTDNRNSIRPEVISTADGVGVHGGDTVLANAPAELKIVVPATAMRLVDDTSCVGQSADECRTLVLDHLVGSDVDHTQKQSRCYHGCNLMGGIVHSTPTVVPGKPSELLRDESYEGFVRDMFADKRPTVLYTSTVDGFLHAFNLAPFPNTDGAPDREIKEKKNNELWAFIPPAVLPVLRTQYPSTPATLLDGVPIIKDVVSRAVGGSTRYERLQADAQAGSGNWRTVLLQSFGEGQVNGGYFAVDITQPDREGSHAPKFLWQLTRDASGNPLFGNGGTPLITTVYLESGLGGSREVAVAVLPGGDLPPGVGTVLAKPLALGVTDPEFETQRTTGRNYAGAERARSLTIVRLDTGEVLRTFRPTVLGFSSAVHAVVDIPAPITGQPKAFPNNTGAVADRIFVGDRDGRMWRVDVSSLDPTQWEMKVFIDAFYDNIPSGPQPVVLAPALSTDDDGSVTLAFATGDQQATAAPTTMVNRVMSVTEKLSPANAFVAQVNWVQSLDQGYRVTGPMELFNKSLYYAASKPPDSSGATCNRGSAKVFAAHYLDSEPLNVPHNPPKHADGQTSLVIDTRSPGMIFGLSLQADPTCKSETETVTGDESYGYGLVQMSKKVNPGKYFLTYQVSGTDRNSSGAASSGDTTQSTRKGITAVKTELDTPHAPVSFESWALIYE
jgi:type IV pilus assembly protein PilY1